MPRRTTSLQLTLRPMTMADLSLVVELDRISFPTPWPKDAFAYELTRNRNSVCWVAEWLNDANEVILIGSVVIWLEKNGAHIGTLAIKPGFRQRGIGQQLLAEALRVCIQRGAQSAMLEVRAGNKAAQALYRKFGFEVLGLKEAYYQDTQEDALIMILDTLDQDRLDELFDRG
jgi:[ribosomal protein S18]-alanine N-acetyltransferase